jgi:hypothetical protein
MCLIAGIAVVSCSGFFIAALLASSLIFIFGLSMNIWRKEAYRLVALSYLAIFFCMICMAIYYAAQPEAH